MKKLSILSQAAKIILTKKKVPFYAYLSVTQACNLTCEYCFANSPQMMAEKRLPPKLDTEKLKSIMDELWSLGTRMLSLAGGEPMIRQDIGELIKYSKKKGFFTQMYTNGTKSYELYLHEIKKIDHLLISIEGPKDIHDVDRKDIKGRGSYDIIFKNIETLRREKIAFTIVYSASLNNMFEIRRFIKEVENDYKFIPRIVIAEVLHSEEEKIEGKEYANQEKLKLFWEDVKKLKAEGYPIMMSIDQMNDLIMASSKETFIDTTKLYYDKKEVPKEFKQYAPCSWGKYGVFFDTSGYLYPCPKLYDEKKYAKNAFEVGFKEAYRYVSNDLPCTMCRGTINSAMTKLINITPKSAMYTAYQVAKFYIHKNRISKS